MIRVFLNENFPEPFAVQNGFIGSNTIEIPSTPESTCLCIASDCERNSRVLADFSDSDDRKNDKTSFLFKLFSSSDTISIKLLKDDEEIETLDNNNFGTFYDIGSLSAGVPEQDFYSGYLLDWQAVLLAHGIGYYTIKADFTQFGSPVEFESQQFYLLPYSDDQANGSVKLVSYQNGNIESSQFDFTVMNWYQQIRFNGILWNKQSEFITDNYFNSNRKIIQIQDQIKNTYSLQIEFLQNSISEFIIENNLIANSILVTDYNVTNTTKYTNIPLAVEEIADSTELYYYNGRSHEIIMTDRTQNIRKRNY